MNLTFYIFEIVCFVDFFLEGNYFPYLGHSFSRLSSKGISPPLNIFSLRCIHTIRLDWQKIGEKAGIPLSSNQGTHSGEYFSCFMWFYF
jgi:hypothetical protein